MKAKKVKADMLAYILPIVENANIPYCTPTQVLEDCEKGRLYALVDGSTPVAICSVVDETNWGYTALKRMLLLDSNYAGKGCAVSLMKYLCGWFRHRTLGGTPWVNNPKARHIFEKCGFTYQYTFMENYAFYKKA